MDITYYLQRLIEWSKEKFLLSLFLAPIINHFLTLPEKTQALLVLLLFDTFLGLTLALLNKNLCSRRAYHGITKFILYFFIYYAVVYLDKVIFGTIHCSFCFTTLVVIYLSITETISILENISAISIKVGIPNIVPDSLIKRLHLLREDTFGNEQKTPYNKTNSGRDKNNKETNWLENNSKEI